VIGAACASLAFSSARIVPKHPQGFLPRTGTPRADHRLQQLAAPRDAAHDHAGGVHLLQVNVTAADVAYEVVQPA
jgi:hypothetical protein